MISEQILTTTIEMWVEIGKKGYIRVSGPSMMPLIKDGEAFTVRRSSGEWVPDWALAYSGGCGGGE